MTSDFVGEKDHFNINLKDEVVRGSIILEKGKLLFPPPPIAAAPAQQALAKVPETKKEVAVVNPFTSNLKDSLLCTAGKIIVSNLLHIYKYVQSHIWISVCVLHIIS